MSERHHPSRLSKSRSEASTTRVEAKNSSFARTRAAHAQHRDALGNGVQVLAGSIQTELRSEQDQFTRGYNRLRADLSASAAHDTEFGPQWLSGMDARFVRVTREFEELDAARKSCASADHAYCGSQGPVDACGLSDAKLTRALENYYDWISNFTEEPDVQETPHDFSRRSGSETITEQGSAA